MLWWYANGGLDSPCPYITTTIYTSRSRCVHRGVLTGSTTVAVLLAVMLCGVKGHDLAGLVCAFIDA